MAYEELSIRERVKRYRELASEASAMAERAKDDDARRAFLTVAAAWEALADALGTGFGDV